MATIQTAFSISANKSSATTTPGPLSVAISASATSSLTVDEVQSKIITVGTTHLELLKGAEMGDSTDGAGGTADNGGFLYLKNTTASGSNLIYIGIGADDDVAQDLSTADQPDSFDDDTANQTRFMTLQRGEWAFIPWDYTMRLTVDANAADQQLEYWLFNRA